MHIEGGMHDGGGQNRAKKGYFKKEEAVLSHGNKQYL
jgi:hypothetical protein